MTSQRARCRIRTERELLRNRIDTVLLGWNKCGVVIKKKQHGRRTTSIIRTARNWLAGDDPRQRCCLGHINSRWNLCRKR